jgi:hypothetical protein
MLYKGKWMMIDVNQKIHFRGDKIAFASTYKKG